MDINAKHIPSNQFYENSMLTSQMMRCCKDNGVHGDVFLFNPNNGMTKDYGMYFLISSFNGTAQEYIDNPKLFEERLDYQRDKGLGIGDLTSGQFLAIDISNLDSDSEAFNIFMTVIRGIEEMATIKAMTSMLGYATPDVISRQVIYDAQQLYLESKNPQNPDSIRARNNAVWINMMANIDKNYNQDNKWNDYVKNQEQIKPLKYFSDNMINTRYTSISADFYHFFKEAVKEYPGFIYYKEARPLAVFKDRSKNYKGPNHYNIFANEKERSGSTYMIAYSEKDEDIFQKLLLQYNSVAYDGRVMNISEIINPEKVVISQHDMANFNSLCKANNVPYYVDQGNLAQCNEYSYRNINILIPSEKHNMVISIMNRLADEKVQFTIATDLQKESNRENFVDPEQPRRKLREDTLSLTW